MIFRKKNHKKTDRKTKAKISNNKFIYAIGDIHGRLDLLQKIHELIDLDIKQRNSNNNIVIYLGDFIDRGKYSKQVIDELIERPVKYAKSIYIRGNHEHIMQEYLNDYSIENSWFSWGGDNTVRSYGIKLHNEKGRRIDPKELQQLFCNAVDKQHREFFKNLKHSHIEDDYIFVHAGLKPNRSIAKQNPHDMMTIRDEFVNSNYDFGKTIVFGHTIQQHPLIAEGRIGVDTGAYATGVLTAAVLYDDKIEFIQT